MKVEYLKITAALLMLASASAFAGKSVDKRWDIDAKASISIENIAGQIVIRGWDKNEAQLTGELGDSVDELEINADKSSLQISVVNQNERNVDNTRLMLMVPRQANLEASGVSADISVSDMDSKKISASSISGDIEVDASSEWVSIEAVSGDVSFAGKTEQISAESVSGDIDLTGISGAIAATAVSGDMELKAGIIESAKLETVSGDILATGELSGTGRLTAESMSGDVTITLPAGQPGLFKAQSFSGRISTEFGSVEHAKHGPGSHLKYNSGKGGAEIRVESFSGNIKLKHD